ncbi:YicC family protein [Aliifodinibius sp. S!AR15-10]|uniref:YicC/YloC family endoribonuclease n=1 Tax=Aliifodinibius sp. S!AR15-10 TaxID=2950437 RepID=UPI0028615128|nr:YicC/YloC family endoribonuclease [Aliifodinibius sp. S!AR15-10]MDR8391746.1 YicC family protein [Aliifodinibius sp. S!AR15-10]
MIVSMTGFGRGEASSDGIALTAEIRAVNSRYLDLSIRMPQEIQERELDLKEIVQEKINRGKLNINIRLNQVKTGEPEVTFSEELVKGYKKLLEDLRAAANIDQPVTLRNLMTFNDIFVSREQDEETLETIWELSKEAVNAAIEQLNQMRRQEGKQLENDLHQRITNIDELLEKISVLTKDRAEEAREKLTERLQNLISDESLDPERLEMEVAILADKMDITEEVVRLQSHIKFFREALEQDESVGRRLNFLSQEINREINTIGSKANSSEISKHVVHAKENLEQIREQVQNIE